jgi:autotransporter-associated beta strand protein
MGGIVSDSGSINFNLSGSDAFSGTLAGSGSLNIEGGGTLVMSGGDAFTGTNTINGGTLELTSASAAGTGPIIFASNGDGSPQTLQIDGSTMPANVISGFVGGDTIDLASVSFVSGGSASIRSGNVLQVVESGQTYDLNFDPTQNFSGGQFNLSSVVGCEHSSRSDGERSSAILNIGSPRSASASLPSS